MAAIVENITKSTCLELGGGRELVDGPKAVVLINKAKETFGSSLDKITKIRLSNKSFDNDAAEEIAKFIDSLKKVTVVDLSDIIAGRPEEIGLKTLNIISNSLRKFQLVEVNVDDNAMGAPGVLECKNILTMNTLEKLYMCNDGLSGEACEAVADILLKSGTCTSLKVLNFYNNMSGSRGAKAIAKIVENCPILEDFRFSATRAKAEGTLALAKSFSTLTTLKKLDIADNLFDETSAKILVESLQLNPHLEYLNVRDIGLGDSGAIALLDIIPKSLKNLLYLDLSGNDISEDIAENLYTAFSGATQITHLFLEDNDIGSDGMKIIAKGIKRLHNLKFLSCNCCDLTASGAYILTKAVTKISSFKKLNINGNAISGNGIQAIENLINNENKELTG